jgi:hypothetical protein
MDKLAGKLLLVCCLLLPLPSLCQTWLQDRSSREGKGISLGNALVLHPGAVVEGGWNSNPVRLPDSPYSAGRLRISGYLDLATRSSLNDAPPQATPPKATFRIGGAGYYDFFYSKVWTVDSQDNFGIDAYLDLILFPKGPFTVLLKGAYKRTLEPYESLWELHARDTITPAIGFELRPGGGALKISLHYSADILMYEAPDIGAMRNKITHDVAQETAWKVFPKTALVSIVRFSPVHYIGVSDFNNDSKPVRCLFGLRGLMTDHIGVSLFVGYGASFYQQGDDFDGVIANGEVMFFVLPTANLRIGGERDFVDSFYANFYVKNGGYVKYEQTFKGIFLLALKSNVNYRDYSELSGYYRGSEQTDTHRTETWLDTELSLEYRAAKLLAIIASADYKGTLSSFTYSSGMSIEFQEFEVMAGLRVHF